MFQAAVIFGTVLLVACGRIGYDPVAGVDFADAALPGRLAIDAPAREVGFSVSDLGIGQSGADVLVLTSDAALDVVSVTPDLGARDAPVDNSDLGNSDLRGALPDSRDAPAVLGDTRPLDSAPDARPPGPPVHALSRRFGAIGDDWGQGVGVDTSGNIYQAGDFSGTVDFGGGPLQSVGDRDIFVASYTATGAFRWAKSIGSPGEDRSGLALAVDGGGNVIVTGRFEGTLTSEGTPLVSAGGQDTVVVSYSSTGVLRWIKGFGGTENDSGGGVDVDLNGNAFVTGEFRGTVDFGGGPVSSAGVQDFFVVSYSPTGAFRWVKHAGSTTGNSVGRGIRADGSGNVSIAGTFSGTVDFGDGPAASVGSSDIFVVSYSPAGVLRWARRINGSTTRNECHSVAIDKSGNAFITGYFTGTADFGGGPLVSVGPGDIFVASYSAAGVFRWARRFGSVQFEQAIGTATDSNGNLYVTGYFSGTIDLGGGGLVSSGMNDIFVGSYSSTGAFLWAQRYGGTGADFGQQVAVDGNGDVFLSGSFQGTVNFGGGPLTAGGSEGEVFLLKLTR